jgi:hypothetical protein
MTPQQSVLLQQRQALLRAIARARQARADDDAEILLSVVNLLEEFYDAFRRHMH